MQFDMRVHFWKMGGTMEKLTNKEIGEYIRFIAEKRRRFNSEGN